MERAAKLLSKMKLAGCLTPEQVAVAAWPAAVGERIAAHTRAQCVTRGKLIVEVEDHVWQTQLGGLRGQIMQNMARLTEPGVVGGIEFRIMAPRRGPQRALTPRAPGDEATAIADPVLGRIYRLKRQGAGS